MSCFHFNLSSLLFHTKHKRIKILLNVTERIKIHFYQDMKRRKNLLNLCQALTELQRNKLGFQMVRDFFENVNANRAEIAEYTESSLMMHKLYRYIS